MSKKFETFIDDIIKKPWGEYPKIIGDGLRDFNEYTKTADILLPSFLVFLIIIMLVIGYIIFFL